MHLKDVVSESTNVEVHAFSAPSKGVPFQNRLTNIALNKPDMELLYLTVLSKIISLGN